MRTARPRLDVVSSLLFRSTFFPRYIFRFRSVTVASVPYPSRPGGFQDAGKDGKLEMLPVLKEEIGDVRQSISFYPEPCNSSLGLRGWQAFPATWGAALNNTGAL